MNSGAGDNIIINSEEAKAVKGLYDYIVEHTKEPHGVRNIHVLFWLSEIRDAVTAATDNEDPKYVFYNQTEDRKTLMQRQFIWTPGPEAPPDLLLILRRYAADFIRAYNADYMPPVNVLPGQLHSVFPKHTYRPNNEVEHQLKTGIINKGRQDIILSRKNKKSEVITMLEIERDENKKNEIIATLEAGKENTRVNNILITNADYNQLWTEIARAIYDIFIDPTLDNFFTLDQLYKVMCHDKNARLKKEQREILRTIIEIMRITKGYADLEPIKKEAIKRVEKSNKDKESKERELKRINDMPDVSGDFILVLREDFKKRGGNIIAGYTIKQAPLISNYGYLTGQEIMLSGVVYDIREIETVNGKEILGATVAHNFERIALVGYFVERIAAMKNNLSLAKRNKRNYEYRMKRNKNLPERPLSHFQTLSNIIVYETAFKAAGINEKDAATKRGYRKFIEKCFKYWKTIGWIEDYYLEPTKRKNIIDRVHISLSENKK